MSEFECKVCGGTTLKEENGTYVCADCGAQYTPDESEKIIIDGTPDKAEYKYNDNSSSSQTTDTTLSDGSAYHNQIDFDKVSTPVKQKKSPLSFIITGVVIIAVISVVLVVIMNNQNSDNQVVDELDSVESSNVKIPRYDIYGKWDLQNSDDNWHLVFDHDGTVYKSYYHNREIRYDSELYIITDNYDLKFSNLTYEFNSSIKTNPPSDGIYWYIEENKLYLGLDCYVKDASFHYDSFKALISEQEDASAGESDAATMNNASEIVYAGVKSGSITSESKDNAGNDCTWAAEKGASNSERETAAKAVTMPEVQAYNGTSILYDNLYYASSDNTDAYITKGSIVYWDGKGDKPAGADIPLTKSTTLGDLYG